LLALCGGRTGGAEGGKGSRFEPRESRGRRTTHTDRDRYALLPSLSLYLSVQVDEDPVGLAGGDRESRRLGRPEGREGGREGGRVERGMGGQDAGRRGSKRGGKQIEKRKQAGERRGANKKRVQAGEKGR